MKDLLVIFAPAGMTDRDYASADRNIYENISGTQH